MNNYIKLLFIFVICVFIVYSCNLLITKFPKIISKNTEEYYSARYISQNSKIIRVEIEILDDTSKDYYDIIEVEFNKNKIDLLKPDASGLRARVYYRLNPGKYSVKWKITKNKKVEWPNEMTFQKTIILKNPDTFVHILIRGSEITVS
jgi:hypothetical protein